MNAPSPTFVKLMMLATSPNDHEAIASLRKANQILAAHNISWEQLLTGKKSAETIFKEKNPGVVEMLKVVKRHLEARGSSAINFIHSLEDALVEWGSLTPNQVSALEKFYKNAKRYG